MVNKYAKGEECLKPLIRPPLNRLVKRERESIKRPESPLKTQKLNQSHYMFPRIIQTTDTKKQGGNDKDLMKQQKTSFS